MFSQFVFLVFYVPKHKSFQLDYQERRCAPYNHHLSGFSVLLAYGAVPSELLSYLECISLVNFGNSVCFSSE